MSYLEAPTWAVGGLLLVAGVADARLGRVPANLTAGTLLLATLAAFLTLSLTSALFGLAVAMPVLVAWLLSPSSTGGADVKLTAAATLASGWPAAAAVMVIALATLLIVQLWARLQRRQAPTVYCAALATAYLVVLRL